MAKELSEQIQQDIITYLDGMPDNLIDKLCQIIVDNFKAVSNG